MRTAVELIEETIQYIEESDPNQLIVYDYKFAEMRIGNGYQRIVVDYRYMHEIYESSSDDEWELRFDDGILGIVYNKCIHWDICLHRGWDTLVEVYSEWIAGTLSIHLMICMDVFNALLFVLILLIIY